MTLGWLVQKGTNLSEPIGINEGADKKIRAIIVPIANDNQPIHPHFGTHNNNNMTLRPQGRPRRIQLQQQSWSPAAPPTTLTQPEETVLDSSSEQTVLRITNI
jgi:hypothetical protein